MALGWAAISPTWGPQPVSATDYFGTQEATIETATGRFVITVEIAATPAQRQRGLQGRRHLPPNHGMLFDFGRVQPVIMWMKDTPLSLDMIFLDESGQVINIAEQTEPWSLSEIPSLRPARAVLEVLAGTAKRLNLAEGDRVIHPIFTADAGRD